MKSLSAKALCLPALLFTLSAAFLPINVVEHFFVPYKRLDEGFNVMTEVGRKAVE